MNELRKWLNWNENDQFDRDYKQTLWNALFENRADSVLRNMAKEDREYQDSLRRMEQLEKEFEKYDLSEEQWVDFDKILSAYNDSGIEFARIAYCLGLKDGAMFLNELRKEE